jgi:hypothetical protein
LTSPPHHPHPHPAETPLFFEFSLCLSRACLGKIIIFIYKWRKNTRFLTSAVASQICCRVQMQRGHQSRQCPGAVYIFSSVPSESSLYARRLLSTSGGNAPTGQYVASFAIGHPAGKHGFHSGFLLLCVCPEPVLANEHVFHQKWGSKSEPHRCAPGAHVSGVAAQCAGGKPPAQSRQAAHHQAAESA